MEQVRVKLGRAPIRKSGPPVLDTTVKSAKGVLKKLAPSWEMVWGHKGGALSDEEYTHLYNALLEEVPEATWLWIHRAGVANGERILFGCYCRDGVFCHTRLIVQWACKRYPHLFENNLEEGLDGRRDDNSSGSDDGGATEGSDAQASGQGDSGDSSTDYTHTR